MAKYCATEFLGSYFSGKEYTTREEMLMFVFTMFDEGIMLPGYFDNNRFVFDGEETVTTYANVSSRAWYAPYLAAAHDLDMVADTERWGVAAEVSDKEIQMMIRSYLATIGTPDTHIPMTAYTLETTYGTYSIGYGVTSFSIAKN
jgi:hypothetical protein